MSKKKKNTNKGIIISIGCVAILIAGIFIARAIKGGESVSTGDLIIPKSEITENVKFYPYNADGTKLEVLAVKASDGSIRTAFNTCQVCNGSPRAYFKQQADLLVCQNCGNSFRMDMVEQERGGCNPVPITKEEKTDDGSNIIISRDFILQNKELFPSNWKTR
ncbi:DUF2318 domain-containing protein [Acetivibrio straminisolvens]|jgi:uncharacterized membrane protein|uniref:Membrane iron-sulfur containing protein FtrD-like domain-containing protein n=1 Tax=Acetivibrio straminisolvens JCM 21531 TaxID=1294263 RepID=W4V7C2_9FIRM|nr:DUF2318 domain-containing protein [Acetivibrio straminisolvens]GAE88639.1 hypothetical protein JCM21531_2096 [Acetivibrio straminisolvens JCM 21531]